jgi:hypothetical protein
MSRFIWDIFENIRPSPLPQGVTFEKREVEVRKNVEWTGRNMEDERKIQMKLTKCIHEG